jgi:hypothetical protein
MRNENPDMVDEVPEGRRKMFRRMDKNAKLLSGSAAFTRSQHGKAGPAVFAGDDPGVFKMITGSLVHNDTLSSACWAGIPDNVTGPGAHDIGM